MLKFRGICSHEDLKCGCIIKRYMGGKVVTEAKNSCKKHYTKVEFICSKCNKSFAKKEFKKHQWEHAI